jgi:hypothetical protein
LIILISTLKDRNFVTGVEKRKKEKSNGKYFCKIIILANLKEIERLQQLCKYVKLEIVKHFSFYQNWKV